MKNINNYRNEKYYFRIIDVTVLEIENFKEEFNNIFLFRYGKYKNTKNYTLLIELDNSNDYTQLIEYILQNPQLKEKSGIYISLTTELDHDGLSIPIFVLNLFQQIGGSIDFSFTSI